MRVLQINKLYYPWVGGIEKIVQQISEGLNNINDIDIEALCCQSKGNRKIEKINGVKIYRASSFGIFWGMPLSFDFFRLFKKIYKDIDIIDLHHPFPIGNLAIFLFKPKTKLIIHYHSDIVRQKLFGFLLKPLIVHTLKKADKIIVSSPNLLKSSELLKKFQKKCEIIPYGVNFQRMNSFSINEVKKIKESFGKFILFVGRLNYYKGLRYLIEAMKDIEENLIIIGEGPFKKGLESKIKGLKIENKVYFLPFQKEKDLINYYHACDVFVLPSIFKSEAFGIVLIEAMACGKPVISTELGTGTSFVNKNGVTGLVVLPKDVKSLSSAIKKISEDKILARKFGQNAFEGVKKEFDLERMLNKTVSVYHDVLIKKSI